MDYKEEQDNEVEALEAIFSDELEVIAGEPFHCISVFIQDEETRKQDDVCIQVSCRVQFTFVEKYPDEVPVVEVTDQSDNITEEHTEKLTRHLLEEANENLGMAMVYTLVSSAQEFLHTIVEEISAAMDAKIQAAEEEQRKLDEIKYKGTPVTLENFKADSPCFKVF